MVSAGFSRQGAAPDDGDVQAGVSKLQGGHASGDPAANHQHVGFDQFVHLMRISRS